MHGFRNCFKQEPGATTLTVPVAYDNNQHAENETFRLGNPWDGLDTLAALMTL